MIQQKCEEDVSQVQYIETVWTVLCSNEFIKVVFKYTPFKSTLETLLQHYVE